MAELDTSGGGKKKGGVKSKKASTRVDLTAMVDLGFLLITFFMLTTTLSKPKSMELNMPAKDKKEPEAQEPVAESRTTTVVLGEADSVFWWHGITRPENKPNLSDYSDGGIRKVLLDKIAEVKLATPDKDLVILIKPTEKSNYKNMVDILDEMAITKAKTYAIVDPTPDDFKFVRKEFK
jgi:biopolymer transport protein ExbD